LLSISLLSVDNLFFEDEKSFSETILNYEGFKYIL